MSNLGKPKILSLLGCYWQGNEATGPSQSFRAFATGLQDDFDIRVVSRQGPFTSQHGWHTQNMVSRAQLPIGPFGAVGLLELLRNTPHDVLLLNGFHDREFTIPALVWRKLGLVPKKPTILSPRGEFAGGALSLRSGKKNIYRKAARLAQLTSEIWFHATADHERADIESTGLPCLGIFQAPNFRHLPDLLDVEPRAASGPLQIAFLGRISPVKNLEFALDVLARVSAPLVFDIFGPMVDPEYWARLQSRIARMPDHIAVTLHGGLPYSEVNAKLALYDLFFLPTLGENFGHAINEALSSGLPVLIADTTPWRGLQAAGAGWDLPLNKPQAFSEAIETFAKASTEERSAYRRCARLLAERSFADSNALEANRQMLRHILEIEGVSSDLER